MQKLSAYRVRKPSPDCSIAAPGMPVAFQKTSPTREPMRGIFLGESFQICLGLFNYNWVRISLTDFSKEHFGEGGLSLQLHLPREG